MDEIHIFGVELLLKIWNLELDLKDLSLLFDFALNGYSRVFL